MAKRKSNSCLAILLAVAAALSDSNRVLGM
jgi:hypothetical protein